MDLSEIILVLLNRNKSGNATPCVNLLVQAACLSNEIRDEAERLRSQLSSLRYPEAIIDEIVDHQSRKTVKATLDVLEKQGFISGKQTEEKLLHEIEGLGCKVHPNVLEQLRMNLVAYKLTKLGLQRFYQYMASTQGPRS